jgi:hypothetical protein
LGHWRIEVRDGPSGQPAYVAVMKRVTMLFFAASALLLGGCADSLVDDRSADPSPAAYSPDPNAFVPAPQDNRGGTMPGMY